MAAIVLTGLASNDPVPGVYAEINFAQGPAAGSGAQRCILLLGNLLPGAGATPNTVIYGPDTTVPLQTDNDAIALFGSGSELHRMWRRTVKVNRDTSIYALAIPENPGGVQATGTLAIILPPPPGSPPGTVGTLQGVANLRVWVGTEFIDTSALIGTTAAQFALAVADNINSQTTWPVTASAANGAVTLTSKQRGERGNFLRYQALLTSGQGVTTNAAVAQLLTNGVGSDSNVLALVTLVSKWFYYIVPAANDVPQLGALTAQVDLQATPTTGIRQRVIFGFSGGVSELNSVTTSINSARSEVAWQQDSDWTPSELAANQAGVIALWEAERVPTPLHNFSGFGKDAKTKPSWVVPAPRSGSTPTRNQLKSALLHGGSPIMPLGMGGASYLVKRVTTRSMNGSTPDPRIRDAHKVTICDFFTDDLVAKTELQFSGKDLADAPATGQAPPGPNVVTPQNYRDAIFQLLTEYAGNDQLQRLAEIKAGVVVQREATPPTRLSARIPLQPIDIADQFAVAVDQVA